MITIEKRTRKSKNSYYVYYDDSGEIKAVGTGLLERFRYPFVITNSDDARRILAGTISEQAFIVDLYSDEPEFVSKEEFIKSNKKYSLRKISRTIIDEWDLKLKAYTSNHIILIELNQAVCSRMLSHILFPDNKDVSRKFEIYLAKKNNPDILIGRLSFNLLELLEKRVVIFDTTELFKGYAANDIIFVTDAPFKKYYYEILNEEYVGQEHNIAPNNKIWQIAKNSGNGHIEFICDGRELTVAAQSLNQLKDLELNTSELTCHISCQTPDRYIGSIEIDLDSVSEGNLKKYTFDFDLDDMIIMYQMPRLTIRIRKINDACSSE